MRRRRVRLADGRYLIFYTFGDEGGGPEGEGEPGRAEPAAEPSAAEEQGV